MKNITNISIGIPAYNEGANIKNLLESLLRQEEAGFHITDIIVISDGSTDNTVQQAMLVEDERIKVFRDGMRLGKSERLKQIFTIFKGDVLFLMDADIVINDNLLFSKIIKNSDFKRDGLVGVNAIPYPSDKFFENVLECGVLIMKEIAANWHKGNNYLSFKGCFLGLDRKFAKSVRIVPGLVNNDAYLYFSAVTKGFTTRYLSDIKVFYKSPATFSDHLKQSSRYQNSQMELKHYFHSDLKREYQIPFTLTFIKTIKYLFLRPIHLLSYIGINILTRLKKEQELISTWNIAVSTKGGSHEPR